MSYPVVSIVMSVFNGQAFLSEAIESIRSQTFSNYEFVVINDGSTDKTAEILSAYASSDARMHIIHHENKGRAASLNIGIGLAKGNYIARMDADDISLPHRLEAQVDFMDRNPSVGVLGGAVEVIRSAGHVLTTFQPPVQDSDIKSKMLHGNPMWHPTVVMRKEVVLAAGGYRKPLLDADDYDLFLRMGERSQLANLSKLVLQYRIHANQVSVRNMRHQMECFLAARAAASLRARGSPDPLAGLEEITPQLLNSLGVTTEDIRRKLLETCNYWVHLLKHVDSDSALRVIGGLLQLPASGLAERSVLADAWLAAASIHYRHGRSAKALISAGRAVMLRPIVVGRPVKRMLTRFASALNR
jgi:hypothetical protein